MTWLRRADLTPSPSGTPAKPYASDGTTPLEVESDMYKETENCEAVCPACSGPGKELGMLGNRHHFRCAMCGMDWSHLHE